jgi:hypothetical protein
MDKLLFVEAPREVESGEVKPPLKPPYDPYVVEPGVG